MQYKKINKKQTVVGESNKQLSVTIATRFDWNTARLLRQVAQEKGVGVTTIIRMWILDRLKHLDDGGPRSVLIGVGTWFGKN
ncbi:hypothetical protein ACFLYR_06100 [Chloroflexota bacterium]